MAFRLQENTAEEVALVESSHQGEQMEAKQPTHIASQNSLVDLRDGIPSAFVKYILRIKTVLEPLHDFHVAFLRCDPAAWSKQVRLTAGDLVSTHSGFARQHQLCC